VAGSAGSYSGQIGFSLKASTAGSVIAVQNNDQITISYNDIAPAATRTATATWTGASATLAVDSASYHGATGKMTITLTDNDAVDSTVVVNVKSTKDTAGISVTLKGSNFSFSGQVGFSMGASSASAIAVKDSDVVTVSYSDVAPVEVKTTTASWYATLIPALGIYSNDATPGVTQKTGLLPKLITWSGTVNVDSVPNFKGNGNTVRFTSNAGSWAGAGWSQVTDLATVPPVPTGINMSEYIAANANCTLHVRMKGTASIELLIENLNPGPNPAMQKWVPAANFGYTNDDQWYEVKIPLSQWAVSPGSGVCDFTNISYFMGMRFVPFGAGLTIAIDDLYWTLP
jgi:hypothetical protein